MSGADRLTAGAGPEIAASRRVRDAPVLETRGVRLHRASEPIDFSLRGGELVGLAGLEGQGQDLFLRTLATGASTGDVMRMQSDEANVIHSAVRAAELGVAYVPRDRRSEALFSSLSIRENFAVPTLSLDRQWGIVRRRRTEARFRRYREQLNIVAPFMGHSITTLSGGNQQKVVMARWLAAGPAVLLLNDPTRGVDLNAKRDLYRLFRALANDGVSVVMVSTEVDELIELMDRVLVFREGSVSAEISRVDLSRETLVAAFFGTSPGGSGERRDS